MHGSGHVHSCMYLINLWHAEQLSDSEQSMAQRACHNPQKHLQLLHVCGPVHASLYLGTAVCKAAVIGTFNSPQLHMSQRLHLLDHLQHVHGSGCTCTCLCLPDLGCHCCTQTAF